MFKTVIFINFIEIQATMHFIDNKSEKIKNHKFYDFCKFNIIEMKNRIARDCKSNSLNESIKKSQQTIKFFKVLLSKIVIKRRSNNL